LINFKGHQLSRKDSLKMNIIISLILIFIGMIYLSFIPGHAARSCLINGYHFTWLTGQTFPLIAVFMIIGSSVLNIIHSILDFYQKPNLSGENSVQYNGPDDVPKTGINPAEPLIALMSTGLLLIYIWMMVYFGYLFATPILIGVLLYFLEYRQWKKVLLLSILPTLILYFFFTRILFVPLPVGLFGRTIGLY